MDVRAELADLRSDLAPLHRAQANLAAALEGWRLSAGAGLEDALARFAEGADPMATPALATLFDHAAARRLVGTLVTAIADVLAVDPLGLVPLRHYADDGLASLVLARSGSASLSLQALDGSALREPPLTIGFAPTETWDFVLSGTAEVEEIVAAPDGPGRVRLSVAAGALTPGDLRHRAGRRCAQTYRAIPSLLAVLRLQRRHAGSLPTLEYRRSDGALVHRAAGNPRDSRFELISGLLGAMGRADAAPVLAAMAREAGTLSTRWQALRQALALDTAAGLAALSAIAADAADELSAPAGALFAQLRETHPEIARCPV